MCSRHTKIEPSPVKRFPGGARGKERACQCRRHKRYGFDSWVDTLEEGVATHFSILFLPRESHGQRSLAGYSPQCHKVSDMTEVT